MQLTPREKLIGTESHNLSQLETVIITQVPRVFGCRPFPPKQAQTKRLVVCKLLGSWYYFGQGCERVANPFAINVELYGDVATSAGESNYASEVI